MLYEQELFLNIAGDAPHQVGVSTNWPYYVTRVERCEGFEKLRDWSAPEGGREISGVIDISEFNYIWLRKQLGSEANEARFAAERAKLPAQPKVAQVNYQPEPHERETVFHLNAADSYWVSVATDSATWLRRLDNHPYAVLVEEQLYRSQPGSEQRRQRFYRFPRSLLTIRRSRPQYTEEYREQLRQRLLGMREDA